MADPTIQTFCCHQSNISDRAVMVMQEFNTNAYNTVCAVSSFIGILGAIYQILPREETSLSQRWFSLSTIRGRQIVVWLAVADLLASIGVFVRSILWLHYKRDIPISDDTTSVLFCAISSAWIQYFYMATWFWTFCYALDMRLLLRERPGHPVMYHVGSWVMPAILTVTGLTILYTPDAKCHDLGSLLHALARILPNYCATYLPMAVVMVAAPLLYCKSSRDVEVVIARSLNQYTRKERSIVDKIRWRFCFITAAFYVCWLPNIVNGVLLWTLWFKLPETVIIVIWYIMAVLNPMQALLNSLVYRRWSGSGDRLYIPCREMCSQKAENSNPSPRTSESTPLLHNRARMVINLASTD